MSLRSALFSRRATAALALSTFFLLGLRASFGVIDDAVTKQVWNLKYGVTSAQSADANWLTQDDDGDGVSNGAEIAAGTNPFSAGSAVRITQITAAATTVDLTFSTEVGKNYMVQGSPDLTTPFTSTGVSWTGTGGSKTLTNVPMGSNKFFRILVQDIDTDSDGLSDWAENAVSLNPSIAQSTPGLDDYTYVKSQLTLPNTVSIKATTPFASEDGPQAGMLTISRTQKLLPLTVNYTSSGTAVAGTDYTFQLPSGSTPGTVNFASGTDSMALMVNPVADDSVKGSRSVTATLTQAPLYSLGAPNSATVIINDSTAPTGTGLLARYYDHANTVYAHAANFGDAAAYNYARLGSSPNFTGTAVITPTTGSVGALQVGNLVRLSFLGGNLNTATYNNVDYAVTAKTATTFTVAMPSGAGLPTNSISTCNFSVQAFPHPAVITRVDPTVDFNWLYGTANGVVIAPKNSPDNYSATWDAYLDPADGTYIFQLDADDKAQVLLDTGSGLVPIVEHNWNNPGSDPVGTFKKSAPIALTKPSSSAQRYHLQVKHVETTGDARCRLQWNLNGGTFVNIPQANQYTHTRAFTYSYAAGNAVITPTGGHNLVVGSTVPLAFSSGVLFTPGAISTQNKSYTVTAVTATTFTVAVSGFPIAISGAATAAGSNVIAVPSLDGLAVGMLISWTGSPANELITAIGIGTINVTTGSGVNAQANTTITAVLHPTNTNTGSGFVLNDQTSTITGLYNLCYANTDFANSPGRVGVDAAVTAGNNGIWGSGTPDVNLIQPDTFSIRWTGQVQPQFSEEYTFVVNCDDGCALWINGQPQVLKVAPSANTGGATYTYDATSGYMTINYPSLIVNPGSFIDGEALRIDPSSGNLSHAPLTSPTYTYDGSTGLAVIDYSNLTGGASGANRLPGSYAVDEIIELDPTSGSTSALGNLPYKITAVSGNTLTVDFGTGVYDSGSGTITISDNRNVIIAAPVTASSFRVFIGAGKYADGSTGNVSMDIVNKPLKDWASTTNERFVKIPMVNGVRYDIQLDYYENTSSAKCQLFWYSPSQPRQIIPAERLYPSDVPQAPTVQISATDGTALVGGLFSYTVQGSNGGSVSVSGNPAWLAYSGGVLSGTPPSGAAGDYQILLTITNTQGTSTSVLNLHVDQNAGTVPREFWNNAPGITVADIPIAIRPADFSLPLTSSEGLEGPTDFGDNYGARIRGYITAPVTGNYYFWIAASNAAELWISNDNEPVNTFKRAWVTTGSTTPRNWNNEANQQSPWLALEAGKKYYIEILHKAGAGSGDNVAVGWLKPGETGTAPSEIVPKYILSPYVAPAPGSAPGTLYVATMLSQGVAVSTGVGTSTLRLSADENTAYMKRSYSGLTGGITSEHIHWDPYLNRSTNPNIMYDIDTPVTAGDGLVTDPNDPNFGAYKWTILPVGPLSKADIIEIIKEGKAYINLHTNLYPNGEIRGNYTLANGTRTFTPPPDPPDWKLSDDSGTTNGAARFLMQASFGANPADIAALKAIVPAGGKTRYEMWIEQQFAKPATNSLAEVIRTEFANAQGGAFDQTLMFNAWWKDSVSGDDQLRQRVAFALSQIHVVSAQGPLDKQATALAYFYDHLVSHAFDNFRDILEETTLTPSMGRYLDMKDNDKPDLSIGRSPNENYAREINQLFSIGLYRMWPDGSLMLNSKDELIPTYTQREVVGFAHVFTGWDDGYDGAYRTTIGAATNYLRPMREVPARHFTGLKRILNNEVMPGLPFVGSQPLDPYATHTAAQYNDPAYQALPRQELDAAHDQLSNHPNVGPFICRQLIQRMVTSDPSRDYLYRVVQKFNNDGTTGPGRNNGRGNMDSVIKAILLDYEARSATPVAAPAFGKQREPLLRVAAAARAFRPSSFTGTYVQNGSRTITVNTTTPHNLASGNNVFLDFVSGSPAPWIGSYAVSNVTTNSFDVTAQGWATGTYSKALNSTTVTVTMSNHWLLAGHKVFIDFTAGGLNGLPGIDNTVYTLLTSSGETGTNATFTINVPGAPAAAITNQAMMLPRFTPGSYTTSASGLPAPNDRRVTMDTNFDHHLQVGDQVQINFTTGNPLPVDMVATVDSVVDLNTWTFLAPAVGTNLGTSQGDNGVYQFPLLAQPLNRSGSVNSRPSTFAMGNTDGDFDQSPLNSPTVFNFFLPGYRFPGALASQGLTTPEFQDTAETNVIREANFFERGVYASGNTNGLSSFKSGTNALVMDLSSWTLNAVGNLSPGLELGAGANTGKPWTNDENLSVLIDRLYTLLLGNSVPNGVKTEIMSFVQGRANSAPYNQSTNPYTNIPYNNSGTPSATEKRDRIRAILHLILTSPDFIIQR